MEPLVSLSKSNPNPKERYFFLSGKYYKREVSPPVGTRESWVLFPLYPPKGEEPVWSPSQAEKPGPASRDTEVRAAAARTPPLLPSAVDRSISTPPGSLRLSLTLSLLVLLSRSPPGSRCPAPLPTVRRPPPHEGQGIRRRRGNHRGPHIHLSPFYLNSGRFLKT